jgi:hypothetical protein
VAQGVITPFVAEPLVESPSSGADFMVRAIGTTREAKTDWTCSGEFQFPFHDTEKFTVKNSWVVGFMSSDPLSQRDDALSPVPFEASDVDGWLTGTSTAGSGLPAIRLNEPIEESGSGTNTDAFGFRHYQFQARAQAGDDQPPLPPGGKVGDPCPGPQDGRIAGAEPVQGAGIPDSWTNILYINEAHPFDFSKFGTDKGATKDVTFYVAAGRETSGMVTPFVAEPLVDSPVTGDDFIIRAMGTTRQAETDWTETGVVTFPFSDDQKFEVRTGWLAGFLSSDPAGESDAARSPIPFVGNAGDDGWLTGTSTAASGAPVIALNETIVEGNSGTNVDAYGFRRYQFQITAELATLTGDFDADGVLTAADIDLLSIEVLQGTHSSRFDLNGDRMVDRADRTVWVETIRNTYFGDANLDGQFNSGDLVHVFQAGKYEDATEDNASWSEGDWDGDRDFTSSDFVVAFQGAGYEQGPRPMAVPEPTGVTTLLISVLGATIAVRRWADVRKSR